MLKKHLLFEFQIELKGMEWRAKREKIVKIIKLVILSLLLTSIIVIYLDFMIGFLVLLKRKCCKHRFTR
jgi:preprotein translocase subunit SecE